LASLILVVNVVGELQQKRTLAASRGFLAAARLSCSSYSFRAALTDLEHVLKYIHTYIRLIITYDTPHSGTMLIIHSHSLSRYRKIACGQRVMKLQSS